MVIEEMMIIIMMVVKMVLRLKILLQRSGF
jgi:hypothetical protein